MNIIFGNEPLRLTVDAGLMLFGLLAAFFYAMSLGRKRLILTLLSIYCSVVVFRAVPSDFFALSTPLFSLIFSLGGLVAVTALVYFLLSGSRVPMSLGLPRRGDGSWWHMIILSIAASGFFLSAGLAMVPPEYQLPELIRRVFLGTNMFLWSILPLFAVALTRKKKKDLEA